MSNYSKFVQEDQRLVILRTLCEMPSRSSNSSVLQDILRRVYGHNTLLRDDVNALIRWLGNAGLVTTEEIGNVLIARITERGEHVAAGDLTVDGIKKPRF